MEAGRQEGGWDARTSPFGSSKVKDYLCWSWNSTTNCIRRVWCLHFYKEIQAQSRDILNTVFVSLHLAAAVSIWHLSSLLAAKCFINTLLAVSSGSEAKHSEKRDAGQPVGKRFSKPFLMFRTHYFSLTFSWLPIGMLQLLCSCWFPLPEPVVCVLELTFTEWLVSAGKERWVLPCEHVWQHKWGKFTAEAARTALRCVSERAFPLHADPREDLPSCADPKDISCF